VVPKCGAEQQHGAFRPVFLFGFGDRRRLRYLRPELCGNQRGGVDALAGQSEVGERAECGPPIPFAPLLPVSRPI
jgi:hypothetical protein